MFLEGMISPHTFTLYTPKSGVTAAIGLWLEDCNSLYNVSVRARREAGDWEVSHP